MTRKYRVQIDSSAVLGMTRKALGMTRKSARNDNESTNIICAHSKRILRYAQNDKKTAFGVAQGLNYYIKCVLAVDILSYLR